MWATGTSPFVTRDSVDKNDDLPPSMGERCDRLGEPVQTGGLVGAAGRLVATKAAVLVPARAAIGRPRPGSRLAGGSGRAGVVGRTAARFVIRLSGFSRARAGRDRGRPSWAGLMRGPSSRR
jgi:hypothetical protein